MSSYLSNLNYILEKEGKLSVKEEQDSVVPALVDASKDFLAVNEIDYSEFFANENDPRIAICALAIAEIQKYSLKGTKTRASVGGSVLEGLGIRELAMKGLTKSSVKIICMTAMKKTVPYVGWGLFAVDMAMFLTD